MDSTNDILFLVIVGWLFTHELDAIQRHEWRIFPLTAFLPEKISYWVFVGLHIPLFAAMMYALPFQDFQRGVDVFAVVHVGLHWAFRHHPKNEFNNWFSQLIIIGVAPLAMVHLVML